MGLFGWGEKDNSTPQERKAWRDNAKKQMDEQSNKPKKVKQDKSQPKHARRNRWGW